MVLFYAAYKGKKQGPLVAMISTILVEIHPTNSLYQNIFIQEDHDGPISLTLFNFLTVLYTY